MKVDVWVNDGTKFIRGTGELDEALDTVSNISSDVLPVLGTDSISTYRYRSWHETLEDSFNEVWRGKCNRAGDALASAGRLLSPHTALLGDLSAILTATVNDLKLVQLQYKTAKLAEERSYKWK